MMPVQTLWSYLKTAQELGESGHINLVVGEKELAEDRFGPQLNEYPDHLRQVAIPLKHEGISGTQMRDAIAALAAGDSEAYSVVWNGLLFVPEEHRDGIITTLTDEWIQALAILERTRGR